MSKLTLEQEIAVMKELEQFDTPTVTNAVATYPARQECLGLYDPQEIEWYTDNSLTCLYPDLGARCGLAATCVYGMFDPIYSRLAFKDILLGIHEVSEGQAPVVLVLKNNFNERTRNNNAIIGGNMMTAFHQLHVVGAISDAPARDVDEMRPIGVQCLFKGLAAGHGTMSIQAVNSPVEVAGMMVAPMVEVIHMDASGSVKFPRSRLAEVLEGCKKIAADDLARQEAMRKLTDPLEIAQAMAGIYK